MAVDSHIHSLKARHEELENQIKELTSKAAMDETRITSLKRKKLQIKDRIRELSSDTVS